jgi:ribosome-associated protein
MDIDELKLFVIKKLDDLKIENIEIIDVRQKTSVTDYMIIGTGRSDRHINSTIDNLRTFLKDELNFVAKPVDGKSGEDGWVVLDLIGMFVNLFTEEARNIYKLEDLWKREMK